MSYDMADFDSLNYSGGGCGCNHNNYGGCGCSSNYSDPYSNFSVAKAPLPDLILRPTPYTILPGNIKVPNNSDNLFPSNGKYKGNPQVLPTTEMGGTFTEKVEKVNMKDFLEKNKCIGIAGCPDPKTKGQNITDLVKMKENQIANVGVKRKYLKVVAIGLAAIVGYKLFFKIK